MIAWGGATFAQALSRAGLVDEYVLVINPVALGSGLPMFADLPAALRLELAEARVFGSTALHIYRPASRARYLSGESSKMAGSNAWVPSSALQTAPSGMRHLMREHGRGRRAPRRVRR
jgi:hypothetical protein